jgi:starvation-inducible outer membrane lipoprotein
MLKAFILTAVATSLSLSACRSPPQGRCDGSPPSRSDAVRIVERSMRSNLSATAKPGITAPTAFSCRGICEVTEPRESLLSRLLSHENPARYIVYIKGFVVSPEHVINQGVYVSSCGRIMGIV